MNKPQRMVLGITLILMGIITFVYVALNTQRIYDSLFGWGNVSANSYLLCLLGLIFIGGGFFILFSKKKS